MCAFLVYHGVFCLFSSYSTTKGVFILKTCIDAILYIIPICLLIVLICEVLFAYKNTEIFLRRFIKIIFMMFFIIFISLGVSCCFVTFNRDDDPIFLWRSFCDLILAFFISILSLRLLDAITYPFTPPEHTSCVRWSRIGMWIMISIFFIRFFWDFFDYLGLNKLMNWVQDADLNLVGPRIVYFLIQVIIDLAPPILAMIGAYILRKHDLEFAADPFYQGGKSDSVLGN